MGQRDFVRGEQVEDHHPEQRLAIDQRVGKSGTAVGIALHHPLARIQRLFRHPAQIGEVRCLRPQRGWRVAAVTVLQQKQTAVHSLNHAAEDGQPGLAKLFRVPCLG
jgi:hypothetical protein